MNKLQIAALIAAAASMFAACTPPPKTGADVQTEEETVFAVNTIQAVSGQIFDYIEVNGDIKASSSVDVYPDTAGKVSRIMVRIGQRVTAGQELLYVDPSRPGMNFAQSPVKAPIAGTITALPAEIGSSVAPSIPVATVSRMENLEIVTYVSERYISKVALGQDALIALEAWPGVQFRGKVAELSPVLDPLSRTMEIKLSITEQDRRIKAGMFARVKLIVQEKQNTVKIPAEAMVNRFGENFVFVVNGESVERRKVTPGVQIDNKLEVTEGLSGGEEVVVRGQTLLEDKAQVKVIDRLEPLSAADTIE
ncbi:MAG: efflux RND transporter periplasmic adaptor subunit [Spirochaetales bacterium]|nr:efflux RND transporter periplasmic adaptor subunit [Spirochaetales bacterium]